MTINAKVALVTGASSGIGRAAAQALARAGYRVFGTSRRTDLLKLGAVEMVTSDVTDQDSVDTLVQRVLDEAGRIDLLVNNAGNGLFGAAEETSMAEARALFDANFFGVLRVTNAVLPAMRGQGSGRIVNVSSVLGLIPAPFSAIYAASKHALEGYSESLDHETRSCGIRVVLVEPGYTRTSFDTNMARVGQTISAYDEYRALVGRSMRDAVSVGDDPSVVADMILKAAEVPLPKLRYAAGGIARRVSLLRRFVPASAFDKSLRKQTGL